MPEPVHQLMLANRITDGCGNQTEFLISFEHLDNSRRCVIKDSISKGGWFSIFFFCVGFQNRISEEQIVGRCLELRNPRDFHGNRRLSEFLHEATSGASSFIEDLVETCT